MGIYDRDYMKRPAPKGGSSRYNAPSTSSNLEDRIADFIVRKKKLWKGLGIFVVVLFVLSLAAVFISKE